MVDMGGGGQGRALVDDVARQRLGLVSAGKGLVQRGGLDDTLTGELSGRGGYDRQARRAFLGGRLGRAERVCEALGAIILGRPLQA